jgi:hypothetical protein
MKSLLFIDILYKLSGKRINHLIFLNIIVLDVLQWTSLATACLLVFSAQLGIQYLPYLLMAELFPSGFNYEKIIFIKWKKCIIITHFLKKISSKI